MADNNLLNQQRKALKIFLDAESKRAETEQVLKETRDSDLSEVDDKFRNINSEIEKLNCGRKSKEEVYSRLSWVRLQHLLDQSSDFVPDTSEKSVNALEELKGQEAIVKSTSRTILSSVEKLHLNRVKWASRRRTAFIVSIIAIAVLGFIYFQNNSSPQQETVSLVESRQANTAANPVPTNEKAAELLPPTRTTMPLTTSPTTNLQKPTPTFTSRPKSEPTTITQEAVSIPSFPLALTPAAVATDAEPLAIDFLIESIEIEENAIRFHITIKRHSNSDPLPWYSDESRKGEIDLTVGSQQYGLIEMGGIFIQDTTLQPGQSYAGWFTFEPPSGDAFTFHYPDVKSIEIDLEKMGIEVNVDVSEASTPILRRQTSTPTPVSVSKPACNQSVTGQFKNLWNKYRQELGCPQQARELGADTVDFVEQWFERGHMFFFSSTPVHFVIAKYGTVEGGQTGTGTWQSFSSEPWSGKDENFCNEGNGLDPPIYDNFNRVWCFEAGVRDKIGYPRDIDSRLRAKLYGTNNAQHVLAQGFDNGFILRDSDGVGSGLAYIFLNNGNYIRDYYK